MCFVPCVVRHYAGYLLILRELVTPAPIALAFMARLVALRMYTILGMGAVTPLCALLDACIYAVVVIAFVK